VLFDAPPTQSVPKVLNCVLANVTLTTEPIMAFNMLTSFLNGLQNQPLHCHLQICHSDQEKTHVKIYKNVSFKFYNLFEIILPSKAGLEKLNQNVALKPYLPNPAFKNWPSKSGRQNLTSKIGSPKVDLKNPTFKNWP